jgi:hypothetical protein
VEEVYERLADALERLPNGFPRTPSNVEIQILKKIFSRARGLCYMGQGADRKQRLGRVTRTVSQDPPFSYAVLNIRTRRKTS